MEVSNDKKSKKRKDTADNNTATGGSSTKRSKKAQPNKDKRSRTSPDTAATDQRPEAAGAASAAVDDAVHSRGLFTRELSELMFAFGDELPSDADSLLTLDALLTSYLVGLLERCVGLGGSRQVKLRTEQLLFVLRRWPRRYERAKAIVRKSVEQQLDKAKTMKLRKEEMEKEKAEDTQEEGKTGKATGKKQADEEKADEADEEEKGRGKGGDKKEDKDKEKKKKKSNKKKKKDKPADASKANGGSQSMDDS